MHVPPTRIQDDLIGLTLAAVLRQLLPGLSWTQIRKLVIGRRVEIDGDICMDPARRLRDGETVVLLDRPVPVPFGATPDDLKIRHLDEAIVVVEKPSGINTVRHPAEREWDDRRRELAPTLEDVTQAAVARKMHRPKHTLQRLRIVHRLDKDTSGLVVFARNADSERILGRQFHDHTVLRRYLAIIRGFLPAQKIESWLVRDRGDGRRGSGPAGTGKKAVTHIDVAERLPAHTLLSCRLETGRTHQIRIHLSEQGHPVCGENVYDGRDSAGKAKPDPDEAPRLALHAVELGFDHPTTGEKVFWEMPLPLDLQGFLNRLRQEKKT